MIEFVHRRITVEMAKARLDEFEERLGMTYEEYTASLKEDDRFEESEEWRAWNHALSVYQTITGTRRYQ